MFSYYEGGNHEKIIGPLRLHQNLLVTGIIYPENTSFDQRIQFEARLFLEINSTQKNVKSGLKQEINQIIRPFHEESIAREVLDTLNMRGVLQDKFLRSYYDNNGIATTTIVSYGLKQLVRPNEKGTIYLKWDQYEKEKMITSEDHELRQKYVDYCAKQINTFFSAARSQLPKERWTVDKKNKDRLLTPTVVNGLIGAMRLALASGIEITFDNIQERFNGLKDFKFKDYTSSHYTRMANDLFEKYFNNR